MNSYPSLDSSPSLQPKLISPAVPPEIEPIRPDFASRLAYANPGGGIAASNEVIPKGDLSDKIALTPYDDMLGKVVSLGLPDYFVLSHSGLNNNKLNISSFALVNPLTNYYTGFFSAKGLVRTPLGRLDGVYSRNLLTGENQAGLGKAFPLGLGKPPPVVGFINIKGTFPDIGRKAAIAFGVFGNLAALPPGNPALNALRKSKASTGVGWSGTIENLGGGKVKIMASGVDITSLFTGQDGNSTTVASPAGLNYGNKEQAKLNNFENYMSGSNPYDRAANSKGLNHGDQLAKFANNVEDVRKDLESMGVYPGIKPISKDVTRTNNDAGKILEVALSPGARERYAKFDPTGKKYQKVLAAVSFIGVNGYSEKFSQGNPSLRKLTGKWSYTNKDELIPAKEKPFIDDVLNGSFRKDSVAPTALQRAYDLIHGVDWGLLFGANESFSSKYEHIRGVLKVPPIPELYFKNDWSQKTLQEKYGKDARATAQLDFIKANTRASFVDQFASQPGKAVTVSTDGGKTVVAMCKYLKTGRGPILVIQMVGTDGKPSSPSVGYSVKADGSLAYP